MGYDSKQYYLHNFLSEQPDFNFHNVEVQDYMLGVLRFWLDRGVDGFRIDTVNWYFHDALLRDQPPVHEPYYTNAVKPFEMQDPIYQKNQPENLKWLERMRALTDEYVGRTMVGEVGDTVYAMQIMEDYTTGPRLHMAYNFDMLGYEFNAEHFRSRIEGFFEGAPEGWPSWSFSNHDVVRHVSRWAKHGVDDDSVAKLAIGMLASFEGTLGIYQGEELGQTDTELQYHELTDPQGLEFWPVDKGRDGCRSPMVWEAGHANAGFSDGTPWLPVKDPQAARAVSSKTIHNDSVLNHYKSVLAYRRGHPVLRNGKTRFIDLPEPVLAFHRVDGDSAVTCVFNLSPDFVSLAVSGKAGAVGLAYSCELKATSLELDGNGFVYLETESSELPSFSFR